MRHTRILHTRFLRRAAALLFAALLVLEVLPAQASPVRSGKPIEDVYYYLVEPAPGEMPSYNAISEEPEKYRVEVVEWDIWELEDGKVNWRPMENEAFAAGETYTAKVYIREQEGYRLTEDTRYYGNGMRTNCFGWYYRDDGEEIDYGRSVNFKGLSQGQTSEEVPLPKTQLAQAMMVLNANGARLYTEPDTFSKVQQLLDYGCIVEFLETEEDFVKVREYYSSLSSRDAKNKEGYLKIGEAIALVLPTQVQREAYYPLWIWATVIPDTVNVRLTPRANYWGVTEQALHAGQDVLILRKQGGFALVWYAFRSNGQDASTFGWVPESTLCEGSRRDYLDILEPQEETNQTVTYYVPGRSPLYDSTGSNQSLVGAADAGTIFSAVRGEFYYGSIGEMYVRYPGGLFINYEYVTELIEEYYDYAKLATITVGGVYVYTAPTSVRGTPTRGRYEVGDTVSYYGVCNGFLKVCYKGKTGWIREDCTNLSKRYDRDEITFSPGTLSNEIVQFYSSASGVAGAEKGTPVYIHPEEDAEYLLGYINDGIYMIQDTVQNNQALYYKVEYHGEAGFVPVRFRNSAVRARTMSELFMYEWGGSPLYRNVMDRYYVTKESCTIYSYTDRQKVLGTLEAGVQVVGSANSSLGDKIIQNPIDDSEPYAYIGNAFIEPAFPEVIQRPEHFAAEAPKTLIYYVSSGIYINMTRYYMNPNIKEVRAKLINAYGADETEKYVQLTREHNDYYKHDYGQLKIEHPDERLDGGVLTLVIDATDGRTVEQQFYLCMGLQQATVPSLTVSADENGIPLIRPSDVGSAAASLIGEIASTDAMLLDGSGGQKPVNVSIATFLADPANGFTFDGFQLEDFVADGTFGGSFNVVNLQPQPGGAMSFSLLFAEATEGVEVTQETTVTKRGSSVTPTSNGNVIITVTSAAEHATAATWYTMGKNADGEVTLKELKPGENQKFYSNQSWGLYEINVAARLLKMSFDEVTGVATLQFTVDYNSWADLPIENIFFCRFTGEGGAKLSKPVHFPRQGWDEPPVTEEELSWMQTVLPEYGITSARGRMDLSQVELGDVHIHDFQVNATGGDCESGLTVRLVCACGATHLYNHKSAHDWGGWNVERQPTLEEEGLMARTCATCGLRQEKTLDCLTDADGDGFDDMTGLFAGPMTVVFGDEPGWEDPGVVEPGTDPSAEAPTEEEPESAEATQEEPTEEEPPATDPAPTEEPTEAPAPSFLDNLAASPVQLIILGLLALLIVLVIALIIVVILKRRQ